MRLATGPVISRPEPEVRSLHGLFTPEQTQWVLRRERARADRHQRHFSLVLFRSKGAKWPQSPLLRLAKIVLSRSRATDEMGRFDEQCVCAILPDTSAEGAWKFAHGVCEIATKKRLKPMCAVYAYPGGWFKKEDDNGHNGNGHNGHNHNGENGDDHNGHNGNGHKANGNGHRRAVEAISDRMQHTLSEADRRELYQFFLDGQTVGLPEGEAVKQLEELLVRPMPRWKRALDLVLATTALAIFSPLMLMIALVIKLSSHGPAVFCQPRAGLGGKPFTIFKFRTMCLDAEAKKKDLRALSEQDGPAFKLTDDPRITLIGRFLRKTSLDELPQLWNVVKGDMSLVGPRPLPIEESDNCDQWHRQRLEVTPGLTCIWQVTGRSMVSFDEWVRMDITYIRRRKFFKDLSLLAQTLPAVLLRKGAR